MKQQIMQLKDALKVTWAGRQYMKFRREVLGRNRKNAIAAIEKFGKGDLPDAEKKAMVEDMLRCARKDSFTFDDYFQLQLWRMSDAERHEYISDSERVLICERMNRPENQKIFDDKALTAEVFRKYYQRETLGFRSGKDLDRIKAFLTGRKAVIAKPLSSACGKGVSIVTVDGDVNRIAEDLIASYCSGIFAGGILEELVIQDDRMKAAHPQSVNTVRVPTIRLNDRVVIFHPYYRVGRGGSVVDNAGAGGIICAVDAETGLVVGAADELGIHYTVHPETGAPRIGFQIPEWEAAVKLARELAMVIPTNRYTGWDLALTDKGWVLIEGNARGQFVCQIPLKHGFRQEIEGYLKEMGQG